MNRPGPDRGRHWRYCLITPCRDEARFARQTIESVAQQTPRPALWVIVDDADMLFVGMPSPFKDIFCQRHRDRLDVPVIVGVGGSFDVVAGFVTRAPKAMQIRGLEWAWRLMKEPRKLWKRYFTTNTEFIWLVLREIRRSCARAVRAPHGDS